MNLFHKKVSKGSALNFKNNPKYKNQVNAHKENHADSKPEGIDKIENDIANTPESEQPVQGAKQ